MQGRFTSPDVFWKDSRLADPQSWNKYAYVRNNPVKYIDPAGEKATVTIETDEEKKKGTIKITTSIAIWTKDKNISKNALNKAAADIKKSIEKAWSGSYSQNGIAYTVSTEANVSVASDATDSGAQNVIEMTNGPPGYENGNPEAAHIDPGHLWGPDTGAFDINKVGGMMPGHEFGHLLGVDDRDSGTYLMNGRESQLAEHATAYDYGWALGGAINNHRAESRPPVFTGRQWETLNAGGPHWGGPSSYKSAREIKVPLVWWH